MGRVWCFLFDHKWKSYYPVNAKHGGIVWFCERCPKRVAE